MCEDNPEKTILGLEICSQDNKLCFSETKCPYQDAFPKCCQKLMADAHSLLKAREPRILNLDEVIHNQVPVYIEYQLTP